VKVRSRADRTDGYDERLVGDMGQWLVSEDLHEIAEALATALDAKSAFMCGHSERVAEIALLLARGLGLSREEQVRIHIGAHLHDVGKIGIPDAILHKPGRLTGDEFAVMKLHPEIGYKIVNKIKVFRAVTDIVRHHHERFDGKGYPDGLSGAGISLGARIVAVADAFDAMTTFRTYRTAMSLAAAMKELRRCRGGQFDPAVVEVFERLAGNTELAGVANNGCIFKIAN
jgi:putative nucleotidyltransferase with HDIG domain